MPPLPSKITLAHKPMSDQEKDLREKRMSDLRLPDFIDDFEFGNNPEEIQDEIIDE